MEFFGAVFIIAGVIGLFFPALGWYIRYGWMVKGESEPSDAFLFLSRVGACLSIAVGLYILLSGNGDILN